MPRNLDQYASTRFQVEEEPLEQGNFAISGSKHRSARTIKERKIRRRPRVNFVNSLRAKWTIGLLGVLIVYALQYFKQRLPELESVSDSTIVIGYQLSHILCIIQTRLPFNVSGICKAPTCKQSDTISELAPHTTQPVIMDPATPRTRRNFALLSGGAKVLPELTSPTKGLRQHTFLSRLLVKARGYDIDNVEINLPITVLEDGHRSDCWEFLGDQGYIAIRLPGIVQISDMSVYHSPPSLISYANAKKAPKNMTLWGLTNEAHQSHTEDPMPGTIQVSPHYFAISPHHPLPRSIQPNDKFVVLANFLYDPVLGGSQTFPVSKASHQGWIGFNVVVVHIHSNVGSDSTCLYQLGIHGSEI